ITQAVQDWLTWLRVERGASGATMTAYRRELQLLVDEFGERRLPRLDVEDLRAVLHVGDYSASTIGRRIAAWASFYRWLVKTDRRRDDPTAKLDRPKVARGLPRPVDDFDKRISRLDPVYQLIAVFLVSTGLRIEEACNVDCGVPVPTELRVRGKGSRDRIVPLNDEARGALTELHGFIQERPRTIQRHFAAVGLHPHALRHTFATRLADQDVDLSVIQDLLGHASPATTRVYQRNSPERLRRA